MPQVYYVGLLAGENDMELLARSGVGRDINRHHYSRAEVDAALARPVVRSLLALIRLRNSHPAFGGAFSLLGSVANRLAMRWQQDDEHAELEVDFASLEYRLEVSDGSGACAAHRLLG